MVQAIDGEAVPFMSIWLSSGLRIVTGLSTGHRPMTGTLAVKCCTRAVHACALFREDR
jgi:hypothetical protein